MWLNLKQALTHSSNVLHLYRVMTELASHEVSDPCQKNIYRPLFFPTALRVSSARHV